MEKQKLSLKLDFSKDVIAETPEEIIVLRSYYRFTKKNLSELVDKLLYLRCHYKGKKVIMLNLVTEMEAGLKEKVNSKYLLRDEDGDIYSDDIEIHIISVKEAKKSTDDSKFIIWLKFIGAETLEEMESLSEKEESLKDLYGYMKEFYNSEEYEKIAKKIEEDQKNCE